MKDRGGIETVNSKGSKSGSSLSFSRAAQLKADKLVISC